MFDICFDMQYFVSFLVSSGEREVAVRLLLSSGCHVAVLCLFHMVQCIGL